MWFKRVAWLIAMLFLVYLSIEIANSSDFERNEDTFNWVQQNLTIGVFIAVAFLISAIVSLVLSLIPVSKLKFIHRFYYVYPAVSVFVVASTIWAFKVQDELRTERGAFEGPNIEYKDATTATGDCESLRKGTFKYGNVTIKREGNQQVEIYNKSAKIKTFTINWLSNTEYELIDADGDKSSVKITKLLDNGGYECCVKTVFDNCSWIKIDRID
ncbi:MAG: hypothetical protein ACPGLV_06645 [Bacteroidia bacterium]